MTETEHPMSDAVTGAPTDYAAHIYVASSWKNPMHTAVVAGIRAAGLECYDFKYDEGANFHWRETGLPSDDNVSVDEYLAGLEHPRAIEGFASDFGAMGMSDTFVLVLPCGRSAHLELGWACGRGLKTAILLEERVTPPELMYKMVDYLAPTFMDLLGWLGVED